eukprot:TRINITY_DN972_c2_g1_i3.p1 TRINITY_DN972_c2_g1~~TRINITY_DN972_c2_g1_i3.p1  ORF type:complete len:496 (-),score=217.41 TRINITY_DN972_c2_g1_i3:49-1536(-)
MEQATAAVGGSVVDGMQALELVPVAERPSVHLFLKVRDVVKKIDWNGTSMHEIRDAFKRLFSMSAAELRLPLYIMHKETKIFFELEDVDDLYPNCIVDVHFPRKHEATLDVADIGFGYYAFQKQKLVFCMVGLPARGKSYIAKKICRYLKWNNVPTRIFNVGAYRRTRLGSHHTNEFFDHTNEAGMRQRRHIAIAALDDMLQWLSLEGKVAIYDATNTTRERRNMVLRRCSAEGVQVVFVEAICNDAAAVESYISDIRTASPEYTGFTNADEAERDFRVRIAHYERFYEPIDPVTDAALSWVRLVDVGQQVLVNNIESYVTSRVIHFLMNLHTNPRPIWLTRHGQSEFNLEERLGGDPPLTPKGEEFAHMLADWVQANIKGTDGLTVWTSSLQRTRNTALYINHPKLALRSLDEIDAGMCDSLTYDEVAERHPDEFAARAADKLRYRSACGPACLFACLRVLCVYAVCRLSGCGITLVALIVRRLRPRCLCSSPS